MFDLTQLERAREVVGRAMPPTPAHAWPLLSERLGATAIVKHENHTPIGAFKVRGGLVYVDRLKRERPNTAGLISATRGNHGQSLAFAASRYAVPVTIYVPHGNSVEKNRAMRAFGANLVEHGEDFQSAREEAERRAALAGLELVPSFHPDLVMGVATYALELLRTAPDLDVLYVPIGQGSGICGCILARDLLNLKTEIVGVQSTEAPSYALSFSAGTVVRTNSSDTLADGMATRVPDPEALAIIRKGASRIVQVSDDEVAFAMRAYWTDTHNLAEGAGAAALAAALQEKNKLRDKRVGLILSGGNIDFDLFRRWVMDASPASSSGLTGRSSTPRPVHPSQASAITGCPTEPVIGRRDAPTRWRA
jgi:threonine dehydratase